MFKEFKDEVNESKEHLPGIKISRVDCDPSILERELLENLYFLQGKPKDLATKHDWYMALAYTVRNKMMKNWIDTLYCLRDKKVKVVGYLSAEFLMGPHLGNALINLGLSNEFDEATRRLGLDLRELIDIEEEPGLGNGGLGRLAACYLDSLSTLQVPAIGYGIRYEYGIFDQYIRDGWQQEVSDKWLALGNPWEIARPELTFRVKIGGYTKSSTDENKNYVVEWVPEYEVKGIAYDTPVPGYCNEMINILRLWKSEAVESFDFEAFNRGDYLQAVHEKIHSENLGKVLYPNDESFEGKKLRLSQQYFFVSCSIQDVIRLHEIRGYSYDQLPEFFALQLNDTHPSIAVAELMRILVDEKRFVWEKAWVITQNTFAYTNHTLLPEALEKWPLSLFASLLPRHLEIIYEINKRFLDEVTNIRGGDDQLKRNLSLISEEGEKFVRMAHLATIGSHKINGVSKLHTELLKTDVMRHFNELNPEKFIGITNGVTPRRWMKQYNPALSELISRSIGNGWITNMEKELIKLEAFAENEEFQLLWQQNKRSCKTELSERIRHLSGVEVNPESLFDIMVKRIHEYKRQHLNILHIIYLYNQIRKNPGAPTTARTFIFGGKAAPGYRMAKLIIKLVHAVGERINNDKIVDGRLRVIFYPDFNVKRSEYIYRAADLSEQISMAGKEASGTGNMKFAMNGALTIGTMDGANIEIMEAVGQENFFLFGLTVEQINSLRKEGYRPFEFYEKDENIREIIDQINAGEFSRGDKTLFKPLVDSLIQHDPYFVLKDFRSYIECQGRASQIFSDKTHWTKMSILNTARMGKFSSDRSIREYCEQIWKISLGA